MVELTEKPIDTQAVLRSVESPLAGAVVLFLGTTRELTAERRTASLYYECYREMALTKLAELEAQARASWPIIECAMIHRLGKLEIGETSVAIAVSSAHRQAAFEAGKWLIDAVKKIAPIWKQEQWADGGSEWVHPGLPSGETR